MTDQEQLIPTLPGDILRYEREQKGLTLENVAEQSRIKLSVLAAIESGDTSTIPSVYLRGYIRHYARFLGVDTSDVERCMQNVRGAEPRVQTVFTASAHRGRAEKWIKTSSYLAASALIATLAWQFTHEAVRLSQGEAKLGAPAAAGADRPEGDAVTAPAAQSGAHLNASIASMEVLKQHSKVGAEAVAKEAWAAIGSKSEETGQANTGSKHQLEVRTSADSWVEIFGADDSRLEMDLIRAGTIREYSGEPPFRVMIGRASAVELAMDGKPVDLGPHTRGNVARLTLGTPTASEREQANPPDPQ
jgi:cytoskeleton protein RodZ